MSENDVDTTKKLDTVSRTICLGDDTIIPQDVYSGNADTDREYWDNLIQSLSREKSTSANIGNMCKALLPESDEDCIDTLALSNKFSKETQNALLLLIAHLPFATIVQKLYVRQNNIGPETCTILAKALQHNPFILSLSLGENQIGNEGAKAIGRLLCSTQCSIEILNVEENEIGDEGIAFLARGLEKNTSVQQLFLSGNHFGDKGAEDLGRILTYNQHLQELYISDSRFGDIGARHIAKGLEYNTTLKKLNYFNSKDSGGGMGIDGSKCFSSMLKVNKGLRTLIIGCPLMGVEGKRLLMEGLESNFYMEHFHFFRVGPTGSTMRTQIDFFCRLNKMGRRLLREDNVPLGIWAEIISKIPKGDASLLYYFIQAKPDLFKCLDK